MLGYGYWQSRFDGNPAVIGQKILLDGHPFTIIGVVSPAFVGMDFASPAQVYAPVTMTPQLGPSWLKFEDRRFRWVQAFGRLRSGVTAAAAQARLQPYFTSLLEMEAAQSAFANAGADAKKHFLASRVAVVPVDRGKSGLRDSVTLPLRILMAVAAGVLLIACLNVANLLLARGTARHRELALRLALGANRRRVVSLLLAESVIIAVAGAGIGLLIAQWGAALLLAFFANPDGGPAVSASADGRILAFTTCAAVLSAIVAGLVPAWRSTRLELAPTLKGSGGAVLGEQPRLRKSLVVVQVALSFVLLAGAGLFLRSLNNLLHVDPGFQTSHLLAFDMDLERSGYKPAEAKRFARSLAESLHQAPGVSASAFSFFGVLTGGGWGMGFTLEGEQPKAGEDFSSYCNAVSPGFFKTMGMGLVAGREFDERDDHVRAADAQGWPYREAVVNEEFVKRYYGGHNPIGRHVGIGEDPGTPTPIEIVGVVRTAKYIQVREKAAPQIFFPYVEADIAGLTTYVRTAGDPALMIEQVRRAVAKLDPNLPIFNVITVEDQVRQSVVNERMMATLSAIFAGLATLLAVIGLYGVMSYTVTRRTREIGIRMALGAMSSDVARRILGEAVVLVGAGLAVGLACAIGLGRFVSSVLFGLTSGDAVSFATAGLLLAMVATLAALIPARRATLVTPMRALRDE